jgi:hypothetical protein
MKIEQQGNFREWMAACTPEHWDNALTMNQLGQQNNQPGNKPHLPFFALP